MNKNKKAIDMTPEELNEWLASLSAPQDDALCPHFSDPDPYFKMEHTPREQTQSRLFNEGGHLTVRNYWRHGAAPNYRYTPFRSNHLPLQWKLRRNSKPACQSS